MIGMLLLQDAGGAHIKKKKMKTITITIVSLLFALV